MKRSEHTFQFTAMQIRDAAAAEAAYHEDRGCYWENELDLATNRVEETAGVTVKRVSVTGGWRPEVVVDYGDPAAYRRMQEAGSKLTKHTEQADRYRTDEQVYGSQTLDGPSGRVYELDVDDVHHFRLGGQPRED